MMESWRQSVSRIKYLAPRLERAFSLYEMLVALAVVSTVTTVAVPSFQHLTSSQRMTGAVNTLVTALNLARSEAIKRHARAVLCPSADGQTCRTAGPGGTTWEDGYLLYIDRNGNQEFDGDEITVRVFGATENLRIRTSIHRDHVTYQPSGLASGTNLTFTICNKHGRGDPRTVVVSNSGRPRTSARDTGGGTISCPTAP